MQPHNPQRELSRHIPAPALAPHQPAGIFLGCSECGAPVNAALDLAAAQLDALVFALDVFVSTSDVELVGRTLREAIGNLNERRSSLLRRSTDFGVAISAANRHHAEVRLHHSTRSPRARRSETKR